MVNAGRKLRAPLWVAACLLLAGIGAAPAQAEQEITSFKSTLSTSQAGDHPDIETTFTLKDAGKPEVAKNIAFNTPRGVFGNPSALERCTSVDFALDQCANSAQAGLIRINSLYEGTDDYLLGTAPIYSIESGPDEAAKFAFIAPVLDIPIVIPVTVRTATDYGLRFTVSGITQLTPLSKARLTFWGFPNDPEHDPQRFPKGSPGEPAGCTEEEAVEACIAEKLLEQTPPVYEPLNSPLANKPLTGNPSICTGQELPFTLELQTYQNPSHISHAETTYPAVTACDRPTFKPLSASKLTTARADSASGLDLDIGAPQSLNKAASPSQIRRAIIRLPEGLTINPDAADGQSACEDRLAGFSREGPNECPDSSKIGNIVIESTALEGPIEGAIYFGEPKPGNQYRMFMFAEGFGIFAKLIGELHPDPRTGQITAEFDDLPQLPFEKFSMHLFASDRGVLATPTHCTIYQVESDIFPWNSKLPDQRAKQNLSISEGPGGSACPGPERPFRPRLVAGTSNPTAGAFSDFTLRLDRDDGDQFLGKLDFTMPPGLTASLRGLTYCPEAAISAAAANSGRSEQTAPSCPATSAIGTSNVAAGPGSHPFYAYGQLYVAGPFQGAPLSLVAVTPALAGPYDYGVVVVRVAIHVDPSDAHVFADSETVPKIIGGIPIRMRSIQVDLNKPNFVINPTNCSPFSVLSHGIGDQGASAAFSSFYRASDCGVLPFQPKMKVALTGGKKSTKRSKNPGLRFDLDTRTGDANIKSLAVTLPRAFSIDQSHLGNICSEKELTVKRCEGRTPIGSATTVTPQLDQPLSGPVYAVSGSGGLPKLAFLLDGQVSLMPRAESASNAKGELRTVVPVVPDAQIGHFRFNLFGGKTGYLSNTRNLCGHKALIKVEYESQNGLERTERSRVKVPCGGKGRKKPKNPRR